LSSQSQRRVWRPDNDHTRSIALTALFRLSRVMW
jgi:hypothetical protein